MDCVFFFSFFFLFLHFCSIDICFIKFVVLTQQFRLCCWASTQLPERTRLKDALPGRVSEGICHRSRGCRGRSHPPAWRKVGKTGAAQERTRVVPGLCRPAAPCAPCPGPGGGRRAEGRAGAGGGSAAPGAVFPLCPAPPRPLPAVGAGSREASAGRSSVERGRAGLGVGRRRSRAG